MCYANVMITQTFPKNVLARERPAGKNILQITHNFQSKNGLLVNVSLILYVASSKSLTSKVK